MTKTFTVMCQEASGYGTIWIDYITVSLDSAGNYPLATIQDLATKKCSEEWGRDWETNHDTVQRQFPNDFDALAEHGYYPDPVQARNHKE
jgi:hypothetical protein